MWFSCSKDWVLLLSCNVHSCLPSLRPPIHCDGVPNKILRCFSMNSILLSILISKYLNVPNIFSGVPQFFIPSMFPRRACLSWTPWPCQAWCRLHALPHRNVDLTWSNWVWEWGISGIFPDIPNSHGTGKKARHWFYIWGIYSPIVDHQFPDNSWFNWAKWWW